MNSETAAARAAIAALVARYAVLVDTGRFAEVGELFEPNGVLLVRGVRYEGRAAIIGLFDSARAQVALRGSGRVRHCLTTHDIALDAAAHRATATLYFHVLSDIGLDHFGYYRDEYTDHAGGVAGGEAGAWRFSQREVFVDWRSPNSAFAP